MTFAEKFLKLRKQALLSQEEAAEKSVCRARLYPVGNRVRLFPTLSIFP